MSEIYKGPESLRWLLPIIVGFVFELAFLGLFISPETLNQHRFLLVFVVPFCVIAPIGGWWAVYQCIRHERHPLRYVLLVIIIPLGFTWYYFERYRSRAEQGPNWRDRS
jgi:hypothetical protein